MARDYAKRTTSRSSKAGARQPLLGRRAAPQRSVADHKKSAAGQTRGSTDRRRTAAQQQRAAKKRKSSWSGWSGPAITFNAPSFSAGAVFGALMVVTLAYLPDALHESKELIRGEVAVEPGSAPLQFHFEELLENAEVLTDPDAYPTEFEDPTSTTAREYLLQAASFKHREDADELRVKLRGLGMPAATEMVKLDNGTWFRVTVGPFTSQIAEDRALTRLRENNLPAYRVKRG